MDVVSGEPLFGSLTSTIRERAGPALTKPSKTDNIVERQDRSLFMTRTEVRSSRGIPTWGTFSRTAAPDGAAVLHELRSSPFHPERGPGAGGVWRVSPAVRSASLIFRLRLDFRNVSRYRRVRFRYSSTPMTM